MSEVLLTTVIEKLASLEKKIGDQQKGINGLQAWYNDPAGFADILKRISDDITALKSDVQKKGLPEKELQHLFAQLTTSTALLRQPRQEKVHHHHYFPRQFWVTTGLLLGLLVTSTGWYNTGKKLDDYRANDVKYRYLKQTAGLGLLNYLYQLDSLERSGFSMVDSVLHWEEVERKMIEMQKKLIYRSQENTNIENELSVLRERENGRRMKK